MCNVYEPATEQYLHSEWKHYEGALKPYKQRVGPRDAAPFITAGKVIVGQWGMIRPGQPERVAKDSRGRPLMTNNARTEGIEKKPTFRDAWKNGQRCLIPAVSYDEPYYPDDKKNVWWRFRRKDGGPWMLAGLWSEWTDHATGEVVPNFTMLTMNCDTHPLLRLMHKPELGADKNPLPAEQQDKRTVIPIERADWELWLTGSLNDAQSLIQLPSLSVFAHGAADPLKHPSVTIDV